MILSPRDSSIPPSISLLISHLLPPLPSLACEDTQPLHSHYATPGARSLATAIEGQSTLQELALGCLLADEGVSALAQALTPSIDQPTAATPRAVSGPQLRSLCLGGEFHGYEVRNDSISPLAGAMLGRMLRRNSTLTCLSLRSAPLGDAGCAALVSGLEANSSLVRLDLAHCGAADDALEALGLVLRSNCTLLQVATRSVPAEADGARVQPPAFMSGARLSSRLPSSQLPSAQQPSSQQPLPAALEPVRANGSEEDLKCAWPRSACRVT